MNHPSPAAEAGKIPPHTVADEQLSTTVTLPAVLETLTQTSPRTIPMIYAWTPWSFLSVSNGYHVFGFSSRGFIIPSFSNNNSVGLPNNEMNTVAIMIGSAVLLLHVFGWVYRSILVGLGFLQKTRRQKDNEEGSSAGCSGSDSDGRIEKWRRELRWKKKKKKKSLTRCVKNV